MIHYRLHSGGADPAAHRRRGHLLRDPRRRRGAQPLPEGQGAAGDPAPEPHGAGGLVLLGLMEPLKKK